MNTLLAKEIILNGYIRIPLANNNKSINNKQIWAYNLDKRFDNLLTKLGRDLIKEVSIQIGKPSLLRIYDTENIVNDKPNICILPHTYIDILTVSVTTAPGLYVMDGSKEVPIGTNEIIMMFGRVANILYDLPAPVHFVKNPDLVTERSFIGMFHDPKFDEIINKEKYSTIKK